MHICTDTSTYPRSDSKLSNNVLYLPILLPSAYQSTNRKDGLGLSQRRGKGCVFKKKINISPFILLFSWVGGGGLGNKSSASFMC